MGLSIRLSALIGLWEDDLAPRKHMIAESMSEKVILLRIIFIVELYEEEYFSEIKEASLLYMMEAEGPQPPVVDRTMGVNVPCSTSNTLLSYILSSFFPFMPSVARCNGSSAIGRCIWVKHPHPYRG